MPQDMADSPIPDAPGRDDVETCLRVLSHASANPADPRWAEIRDAASRVHRANKRHRNAERRRERVAEERAVFAATERFREQAPDPTAATSAPQQHTVGVLNVPRPCYVCRTPYREVSWDYHRLCPGCARDNRQRRIARCSLRDRRGVVTGGRVKIGFHTALKMLRDGAEVVVTTRFPRDAARRFAAVPDSGEWLSRLHVYGVDLLDPVHVHDFLTDLHRRFDHLDILINNAAQTIRRPDAYHRETLAREREPLTGRAATVDLVDHAARPLGSAVPTRPSLPAAPADGHPVAAPASPAEHDAAVEAMFPLGRVDESGEPLDLRPSNSWSLRLHQVDPVEWLECHVVNAFVPFVLTARLRGLLERSPRPDRYVVQVSAMEGSFSRGHKTTRHPHTNMAKASLNMLTRTSAADYAATGIHMNSVDTGWVTDESPYPVKMAQREAGFRPPLDVIDGAARVYDPVVRGVNGDPVSGLFLKDYRAVEW